MKVELLPVLVHIPVIWISKVVAGLPLTTPPLCTTVTSDTKGHIVDTVTQFIPVLLFHFTHYIISHLKKAEKPKCVCQKEFENLLPDHFDIVTKGADSNINAEVLSVVLIDTASM